MANVLRRAGVSLLLVTAICLLSGANASAAPVKRRLAAKECAECHQPVLQQQSRKFVHEPFKDAAACESCHKRHGIVGTLVLQRQEPALC